MSADLTEVQRECERRLTQLLSHLGTSLVDRQETGESETYVTGRISGTPLVVYIYEDGEAQLHGPRVDHRFELAAYPEHGRPQALWDDFEQCVRGEVEKAQGPR